jgi:hypothetical protein
MKKRPKEWVVRHSKVPNRGNHWRVIGYPRGGRRKQYWHPTEKEALADAADRNAEDREPVALSAIDRVRAANGIERLTPHNKTLDDAVNFYLAHLKKSTSSVPFSVLATEVRAEFKRRVQMNEIGDKSRAKVEITLKKLESLFRDKRVSEINQQTIHKWLETIPLAARTRNHLLGYTRQIFDLAKDNGHISVNPVVGLKRFRVRSSKEKSDYQILSANQTERLLLVADPEVIPFLALWFFAGIRRATLERLDWSMVEIASKRVLVPAWAGKNDEPYPVTLQDNLIEWLKPHVKHCGSLLVPATANRCFGKPSTDATRDRILRASADAFLTLPDNAGRHTFISMHFARWQNLALTATEANNSPAIIMRHYRHLVKDPKDPKRYWQIRPILDEEAREERLETLFGICPIMNTPPAKRDGQNGHKDQELAEQLRLNTHKLVYSEVDGGLWRVGLLPDGTEDWSDLTFIMKTDMEEGLSDRQLNAALRKTLPKEILAVHRGPVVRVIL